MTITASQPVPASTVRGWTLAGRVNEEGPVRNFPLSPMPFRVGRRSEMELTLPRQTISGHHAELFERDGVLYIRDNNSTNGTFVNGQRLVGEWELQENDLVQFGDAPFRVNGTLSTSPSHTRCTDACDQAMAFVQFDRLISGNAIIPHYQPILDLSNNSTVAYEVLVRSRLIGLETPMFMFTAAAQLGLSTELSEVARRAAVEESGLFPNPAHLFLNTHPSELDVDQLIESCADLRNFGAYQPLTIEIHEGAITEVAALEKLRNGLAALDISLAFDDFGAGQARIAELAQVRPRYLKFDRCMIRELHLADASRRHVVASLVSMANDVGIITLAEGVETAEEHGACVEAGFALGQGYLYGKPMPATHYLNPSPAF